MGMENDSEKMLLEILRMARELVINEYVDRRAQDHNNWLYESERLWATRRIKLQYPEIPPYPTEKEIVERAQTLLKFLILGKEPSKELQEINLPTELPKEVIEEVDQAELAQAALPANEPEIIEEPTGRILPTVLKKIEQIKSKF